MTARPRIVGAVAALGVAVAVSGCATTFDSLATTVPAADTVPATTFVATGSTDELLDGIDAELAGLSERLIEGDGATEAFQRIDAMWVVVADGIRAERPDLVSDFEATVDLARLSVERRRPADADKASRNLVALLAAYRS